FTMYNALYLIMSNLFLCIFMFIIELSYDHIPIPHSFICAYILLEVSHPRVIILNMLVAPTALYTSTTPTIYVPKENHSGVDIINCTLYNEIDV
ncbi:hypothetical protein ACJX0J_007885, partial [Zea mays]